MRRLFDISSDMLPIARLLQLVRRCLSRVDCVQSGKKLRLAISAIAVPQGELSCSPLGLLL